MIIMKKILAVDDDQFTLDLIRLVFEEESDLSAFDTAQEALNYFEHNHFDVIITDIVMPVMNGVELVKKIRERNNEVPIVVISGAEEGIINQIKKLNVQKILTKPLSPDVLKSEVSVFLT